MQIQKQQYREISLLFDMLLRRGCQKKGTTTDHWTMDVRRNTLCEYQFNTLDLIGVMEFWAERDFYVSNFYLDDGTVGVCHGDIEPEGVASFPGGFCYFG